MTEYIRCPCCGHLSRPNPGLGIDLAGSHRIEVRIRGPGLGRPSTFERDDPQAPRRGFAWSRRPLTIKETAYLRDALARALAQLEDK